MRRQLMFAQFRKLQEAEPGSVDITPLLNAAACVVSHEKTIRKHVGGPVSSAVALLKVELEIAARKTKV